MNEKITHWICGRNPDGIDHVGVLIKTENKKTYFIHNPGPKGTGWAKMEPVPKGMQYDAQQWCPTTRSIYNTDILAEANKTKYNLLFNNCYHIRNNMIKYIKQSNNTSCSCVV